VADFTTALMAQLQRAEDSVRDIIAKDGLELLRSILQSSGFEDSEYLKDYKLYAHVGSKEIIYEIVLSIGALEDTDLSDEVMASRKKAMDALENKYEEAVVKSYGLSGDGRVHRIASLRDKRRRSHDSKKPSRDTKRKSHDTTHGAESREFGHKAAAAAPRGLGAPRSMEVGRSGKLKISFTRKLRNTNSGVKYPEKGFEGIMKKFLDGMQDIVSQKFIPELERILSRYS
jgi:hypothetical protein